MEFLAVILIAIGAVIGVQMLTYLLKGHHIPKGLTFLHGGFVVTGLVFLVIYALTTTSHHKHWDSIIIFGVAAIGGLYLFSKDIRHKETPLWLAITHGVIGTGGLIWILVHLLG